MFYNRHPTSRPTSSPTHEKQGNSGSSLGNASPLLIVVIILEILVSAALCVCCFKVRRNENADPFEQNAMMVHFVVLLVCDVVSV